MPSKPQDWKIRQYYQQDKIRQLMVENAEYREVAPTYKEGFGKRPDAINFPGDFDQLVEEGAQSFHASVEKWRNPLLIDNSDKTKLRRGWDLIIDIDCDESIQLASETAQLIIDEFETLGIQNYGIKFSGNRGFHISILQKAFPLRLEEKDYSDYYPQLPKAIVNYLREQIEEDLKQQIRQHGFEQQMQTEDGENPFLVADVENNWGSRHLFRMPYSLHDSSWLVSKPITKTELQNFSTRQAKMENVDFSTRFLVEPEANEAEELAQKALSYIETEQEPGGSNQDDFETPEEAIAPKNWPPTINNILEGLEDGRKRALLILVNFLKCTGYEWEQVESKIWSWNQKNSEPLPESYVRSQLNWHERQADAVPPPNYRSDGYYKDLQVYEGDKLEEQVSNPVAYAFKKSGQTSSSEQSEEKLECPYCGKEYQRESYYKDHVRKCFG